MKSCFPALFALALGALGCGISDPNHDGGDQSLPVHPVANSVFVKDGDVYVAGNQIHDRGGDLPVWHHATLWKNGEISFQSEHFASEASSVFVSGDDVYVAGNDHFYRSHNERNESSAVLWTNGSPNFLVLPESAPADTSVSRADFVFVSGDDVYVVGSAYSAYSSTTSGLFIPVIWKNGESQFLSDGSINTFARSLSVSGEDVYVVGAEQNRNGKVYNAVLWKNGVRQELDADCSNPTSIFVSGQDVYIAGYDGDGSLALWTNNVKQVLAAAPYTEYKYSNTDPYVFVSDGDVYVLGGMEYAIYYWKNGERHFVADGSPTYGFGFCRVAGTSIFVSGDDVYVGGQLEGHPMLWKNGKAQTLPR